MMEISHSALFTMAIMCMGFDGIRVSCALIVFYFGSSGIVMLLRCV